MSEESSQGMGCARIAETRRAKLKELIRRRGFVSIPDLRDAFQASESTIRRDLDFLEEQGEARRTHGGFFCTVRVPGSKCSRTSGGNWEKKREIAVACRPVDRRPRYAFARWREYDLRVGASVGWPAIANRYQQSSRGQSLHQFRAN